MKKQSLRERQLIQAIRTMSQLHFILPKEEEQFRSTPVGFKMFDINTIGLQDLKSLYFSELDQKEVHIHSRREDHEVFVFESRIFYKDHIFDDPLYNHVIDLMTQEYDSTKRALVKILGVPAYQNDKFWEFAVGNRHIGHEYAKRRDVPLELQLINGNGELKLTYWHQQNQIVYLTLGHIDKEESVTLVLGVRPNRL